MPMQQHAKLSTSKYNQQTKLYHKVKTLQRYLFHLNNVNLLTNNLDKMKPN